MTTIQLKQQASSIYDANQFKTPIHCKSQNMLRFRFRFLIFSIEFVKQIQLLIFYDLL